MLDDALVEALEAGREQRQRRLGRELLDERLVELAALRREARRRAGRGSAAVDGLERGRDDVHAQHHPRAAAVRLVVDLPGAQRRVVAVVEEPQLELVAEHGRDGRCSVIHAKACGTRVKTSICMSEG